MSGRSDPTSSRGWSLDAVSNATPLDTDPTVAAVPRLELLAIFFAGFMVLFALRTSLHRAELVTFPESQLTAFDIVTVIIGFAGASAVIAVARHPTWKAERILSWGRVFQVYGGLCIGLLETGHERSGMYVSFACIWILSFTVLPISLRRARFVALTTAAMGPLALMFHVALGTREPPLHPYEWLTFIPNFVAAAISIMISRVIHGLGRQVASAKNLGAYELVELLGRGGMGEVWRAEHHALIRPAAIKLLRGDLTAHLAINERTAVSQRFQREVQATAMLTSPHTVAVYDFGYTTEGTLYYVMELLHGLDAQDLVKRFGPQPAERVIYLMKQACESLGEAHVRNLIHRDVKPANLHLCAIGLDVDFLKVLDFGLVRDVKSSLQLTNQASVSGTPAYIAPEAATHNTFDARGDIYGLGCVAYYLLTGSMVFEGETPAAVIASHIHEKPVPPSRRTELPISKALEDVVLACLEKRADDRPQSAVELHDRLEAVPVTTAWTQQRARRWWRTHLPELYEHAVAPSMPDGRTCPERCRPEPVLRGAVHR